MKHSNIHPDLLIAQKLAYEPSKLICKSIVHEAESTHYSACTFILDNKIVQFRVAKITPTKTGQFVTLWKRIGTGPIMPYDITDDVDLFIISVRKNQNLGQFIFPKYILEKKGFISKKGTGGKRAMRVYPPWDITESSQAKRTQQWQMIYFVEIQPNIDLAKIQKL